LTGEEAPLCGRIVALADVYDALTAERVYRRPMTHEQARAAILRERGRHFDPDIVEAFLAGEGLFLVVQQSIAAAQPQSPTPREAPLPLAAP
ncbi:MAG: HD-GYP domain-containing protein, partial [Planctomycetaceae bacterium]